MPADRPSLRDQSRALPSTDIDWDRHAARARRRDTGDPTANNYRGDDYQQRTNEEDPWPAPEQQAAAQAQARESALSARVQATRMPEVWTIEVPDVQFCFDGNLPCLEPDGRLEAATM